MTRSQYRKPGFKQALKSLGFGSFLFLMGTLGDQGDLPQGITIFCTLFGIFVIMTGIKELYQAFK